MMMNMNTRQATTRKERKKCFSSLAGGQEAESGEEKYDSLSFHRSKDDDDCDAVSESIIR